MDTIFLDYVSIDLKENGDCTVDGVDLKACNKCNKSHKHPRENQENKNRGIFTIGRRRSRWYYPSHGDDLELEGDKVIKTAPEENRRRRTIILYKLNDSWGFSLQSYGIHHRRKDEMELMTYVDHVEQGGAAYQAGMRPGDVILSINGKSMEEVPHKDIVQFIKQTGDTMRVVVLFENCCKKVELHMKYLKLQRTLAEKMFELRSLELQEKRVMKGLPQFDCSRSSRSNSSCSLNSSIPETRSLVPELDRCPSPLLTPGSRSRQRTGDPGSPSLKLDDLDSFKSREKDQSSDLKIRKTRSVSGSMIDLSELKRRRRNKRRPINLLSEKKHFELSPQGGAKSKVLVERLPLDVDGVAMVTSDTENKRLSANGEVRSLECRLAELILPDESENENNVNELNSNDEIFLENESNLLNMKLSLKKDVNSNIMSKSLTETEVLRNDKKDLNTSRSIPCLLSVSKQGPRTKPPSCINDLLQNEAEHFKTEQFGKEDCLNFNIKSLPGNSLLDSTPELSVESPTSSEEYYQTFIEGDLDSPRSPKINLNTHPALMKSESEPISARHSLNFKSEKDTDWSNPENVINTSPIKNKDQNDVLSDLNLTPDKNYLSKRSLSANDAVNSSRNELEQNNFLSPGDVTNRESDLSLMSVDSEASRFSYTDLPGIDISFVNDDTHVTDF